MLTLVDWPRDDDFADPAVQARVIAAASQDDAARLGQVFAAPAGVRDDLLSVVASYWRAS